MKKWVCTVCGYVAEGATPPEKCPVCGVPASKFKEMTEGAKLAAEHEYGIYAKTVKNNADISEEDKKYIFEQLMANFQGECSEVGMYLCMARIAPVSYTHLLCAGQGPLCLWLQHQHHVFL